MDLTTIRIIPGMVWCPEAVQYLLKKDVPLDRISLSTDGGGVYPHLNDAEGRPIIARWETKALHLEFKSIVESGLDLASAVRLVSTNPARHLRLLPRKGTITAGADADLVVLNGDLSIDKVFAQGQWMVDGGEALVKGTYE